MPPLSPMAWLRWDVVSRLLDGLAGVHTVLEVGAGQGATGARLAARYDYLGLEPDEASHQVAVSRLGAARVLRATTAALPSQRRFDLVCAFEVLEHLADDRAALADWGARLRPGGWLLLSVPAHPTRFGPADTLVGHHRRYDPAGLPCLLRRAGLREVRQVVYGFPLGFGLEAARNRVAAHRSAPTAGVMGETAVGTAGSGRLLQPRQWMGPATRAATMPFRLAQRPFARTRLGTGIVALGRAAPQ